MNTPSNNHKIIAKILIANLKLAMTVELHKNGICKPKIESCDFPKEDTDLLLDYKPQKQTMESMQISPQLLQVKGKLEQQGVSLSEIVELKAQNEPTNL